VLTRWRETPPIKLTSAPVVAIRRQISRHYQLIPFIRLKLPAGEAVGRSVGRSSSSIAGFIRRRPADKVARATFDDSTTSVTVGGLGCPPHHHDSNLCGLVQQLPGVE